MIEVFTIILTTMLTFTVTELLRAGLKAWRRAQKKPRK